MLELEKFSEGLDGIIDRNQPYETIADESDGLIFTEGPVWSPSGRHLTFSDIAANRLLRYAGGRLTVLTDFSYKANGSCYLPTGKLASCEHATSRIALRNGDGTHYRVLCGQFQGGELNSPNDIVSKSDGSLYFTDPHFGRNPSKVGVERACQLEFSGVYRLVGRQPQLLDASLVTPNGLCFTADEKQLYLCDSQPCKIWRYSVAPDGSLRDKTLFAETGGEGPGLPDGLKLDALGNVYCCAQGGIHIFAPDGALLGRIRFPVQTANLAFGGDDMKTLFVCATNRVYRLTTQVAGLQYPHLAGC